MAKSKLPAGFKPITGLASGWKPTKPGESLQGKLVAVKTIKLPKKGKQPARDWRVYKIQTKDGSTVDVGESAGTRALANVKKGREVYLEYLGKKKLGGGRQPMRDFLVAVK